MSCQNHRKTYKIPVTIESTYETIRMNYNKFCYLILPSDIYRLLKNIIETANVGSLNTPGFVMEVKLNGLNDHMKFHTYDKYSRKFIIPNWLLMYILQPKNYKFIRQSVEC